MPDVFALHQDRRQLPNTLHAGLRPVLSVALTGILRQRCAALYLGSWPGSNYDELVTISCLTSLQSLEMYMPADDYMGYIPSCWTRLCNLRSLTLNRCKHVSPALATLKSLRYLVVRPAANVQLHLQALTQLLTLRISMDESEGQSLESGTIFLPTGNHVQLCNVVLQHQGPTENLQSVTQLSRLDMTIKVSRYLSRQWQYSLPCLKVITVFPNDKPEKFFTRRHKGLCVPDEWQNYTSLERLTLHGWATEVIPDWITKLQRLKRLDMPSACLTDLQLADLRQLPLLEQLDLGVITFDLFDKLAECSLLPSLKVLSYGVYLSCENSTCDVLVTPDATCVKAAFVPREFACFCIRRSICDMDPNVALVQVQSCPFESTAVSAPQRLTLWGRFTSSQHC